MSGPATGQHIGAKLAHLMHDARVAAAEKIIPAEAEYRRAYHEALMEHLEQGSGQRLAEAMGHIFDHPDMPAEVRDLFKPLLHPEHQSDFLFGAFVLLGAVFTVPQGAAAGIAQQARNEALKLRPTVPLTPAELALIVVKGITGHEGAAAEALYSGMDGSRFDLLVQATGEPPGPQQLAEALRRGYIDAGRFQHGIEQSRIKNEWLDVLEHLRYAPPTPGEVIAGAVEGHLSLPEAQQKLSEAGIDPANFGWLYDTAGRPPGIQEMIQLWRRGDATQADVEMAVRESDVKNKYLPAILKLRRYVPPPRSIVAMIREGAVDDAEGKAMLARAGVEGADADAFLKGAHSGRATSVKEVTAAETLSAYTEGLIGRAAAAAQLKALHYDDAAAEELLALTDIRRANRLVAATANRIRAAYVAHKITHDQAMAALDAAHWQSADRDHALALWEQERTVNIRHLTETQLKDALKASILTEAEVSERLVGMGFTADDAAVIIRLFEA